MSTLARHDDPIVAIATAPGRGAVGIVRVSGQGLANFARALLGRDLRPREAHYLAFPDARGEAIDRGLALWFPAPRSYTGEDVLELQAHGGPAVIAAILDALGQIDGLRMAEPGEFTRRGFENGKLDLTAVEGLADLVAAETEGQRRQAFRQMKGLLGDRADAWRKRLIQALALIEARIDFSDEADVPEDLVGPALGIVQELRDEIGTALTDGGRGERLRDGLVVAIAGPPNAGKSTLLNRLARREAAIVSPYAGTTRDVIEVHLDLGGFPMTLLDTAGIRETDDPVEMEGVARARARAAAADLVLWLTDATAPGEAEQSTGLGAGRQVPIWRVMTKADLPTGEAAALLRSKEVQQSGGAHDMLRSMADEGRYERGAPGVKAGEKSGSAARDVRFEAGNGRTARGGGPRPGAAVGPTLEANAAASGRSEHSAILMGPSGSGAGPRAYTNERGFSVLDEAAFILSAETGAGIDRLLTALFGFAERQLAGAEQALVTRQRHRQSLAAVQHILSGALPRFGGSQGQEELLAEELRRAAVELGRLTGRVDVEDILDVIFRDFCIGK